MLETSPRAIVGFLAWSEKRAQEVIVCRESECKRQYGEFLHVIVADAAAGTSCEVCRRELVPVKRAPAAPSLSARTAMRPLLVPKGAGAYLHGRKTAIWS
jgi:uncharacterized protein with PIN domain